MGCSSWLRAIFDRFWLTRESRISGKHTWTGWSETSL
jgi:hypothetical protein